MPTSLMKQKSKKYSLSSDLITSSCSWDMNLDLIKPSLENTSEDPQWMPETLDGTEHYIYSGFFLYIHICGKV